MVTDGTLKTRLGSQGAAVTVTMPRQMLLRNTEHISTPTPLFQACNTHTNTGNSIGAYYFLRQFGTVFSVET